MITGLVGIPSRRYSGATYPKVPDSLMFFLLWDPSVMARPKSDS